jgi:hypothetical protein
MKKRILLPAICMVISLFATSCSSDDSEYTAEKEPMVTLTVSAGTDEDAPESRAVLSEADASTSPWKWETGDQLLFVSTNSAGKKVASKLTLKSTKNNDRSGEFEGEVPASGLTTGTKYRFFYIGKTADGSADRKISDDEANAGFINIDLTSQTGNLADLKRNCVLTGEAKINVSNGKATVAEGVKLSNVFAVAHFAITARDNTPITKVGLRGKGVYRSAKVNLANGTVTGVSEIGTVADPDENIFFNGKTDFYVTFVPGNVAPSFDGYYADSYTSVVTEKPQTRNYDASKSFVYYNGSKARFSVSDTKQVAITNGNMQYVMPIATYTYDLNTRNLKANSLIRWKKDVALKVTASRTVQPGYYQLASEQWEMAMPKTSRKNATYDIETITVGGDIYASPEKYRIFDLPSWGTLDKPTLLNNTFSATSDEEVKKYDYGHKLKVGNQETRVMTSDEWEYLMPTNYDNGLPTNNRTWRASGVKAAKWIRCHIKALYEQREDDPVWLRGILIFPDDMPYSEAKALFKESNVTFGIKSKADNNETTFEKIRNSGAVFIPFSAYRAGGSNRLVQWGVHGNYATTSRYNLWKRVYHLKITPYFGDGVNFRVWTDPDQGCAVRLVQDY